MADDASGVVVLQPGTGGVYAHPKYKGDRQPMTDEQRAAQIRALIQERAGYIRSGKPGRVEAVDAELRRLGAEGTTPAGRAGRRGTEWLGVSETKKGAK